HRFRAAAGPAHAAIAPVDLREERVAAGPVEGMEGERRVVADPAERGVREPHAGHRGADAFAELLRLDLMASFELDLGVEHEAAGARLDCCAVDARTGARRPPRGKSAPLRLGAQRDPQRESSDGRSAMLPRLNADASAKVDVQETEFSHDLFGRYVCSTWEEVANNGGAPFDAVV